MDQNLDLSLSCQPSSISDFLREVTGITDSFNKLEIIDNYVKMLEEEMGKIDVLKLELPLCVLLLDSVIWRLKEEATQCSQALLKRASHETEGTRIGRASCENKDSLTFFRLWSPCFKDNNHHKNLETLLINSHESQLRREMDSCNDKPYRKKKTQQPSSSSLLLRKKRRTWSRELHCRFVDAVLQLGGSRAATPKQIREHMQVDGLTSDEVKSHLQKYRLRLGKLKPFSYASANGVQLTQNQSEYKEKATTSPSDSPQGPLPTRESSKGISSGDNMEVEEGGHKPEGCNLKLGFWID